MKKKTKKNLVKDSKVFLKKKKKKKRKYSLEQYKNLPNNEKENLVECRKKILENEKIIRNFCFNK